MDTMQIQSPSIVKYVHRDQVATKWKKMAEQPIRTRYLGHVTGYQPIRDQYFLIRLQWNMKKTIRRPTKPNIYCVILNDWDWYIANYVTTMASFDFKFWDMIKLSCSNFLPVLQKNSMFLNEYIAKKPPPTLHSHISGV
eukprot:sb/3474377/